MVWCTDCNMEAPAACLDANSPCAARGSKNKRELKQGMPCALRYPCQLNGGQKLSTVKIEDVTMEIEDERVEFQDEKMEFQDVKMEDTGEMPRPGQNEDELTVPAVKIEHPEKWSGKDNKDVELLDLPDGVLARVLACLKVFDVVRCRQTCHRLKAVSTHPQVWQDRALNDLKTNAAKAQRVALELAPCALSLHMRAMASLRALVCVGLAARTSCAAAELILSVDSMVEEAAVVLRRQVDLGRLRRLTLECRQNPEVTGDEMEMGPLLSIIFTVDGLEELVVAFMFWRGTFTPLRAGTRLLKVPDPLPKPSLKSLIYSISEVDPLLEALLQVHGPTLEKVALGGVIDVSPPLLQRFAAMDNLRKVCVPLTEGVHLLLGCRSLAKLTLVVHDPSPQAVAAGEELLRAATNLTTVKIKAYLYSRRDKPPKPRTGKPPASAYSAQGRIMAISDDLDELAFVCCAANKMRIGCALVAPLVRALASSGCSRVERLSLGVDKDELAAGLVGALAGLGALRDLRLQHAPEGFLRGIRPAATPALRRLHVWWLPVEDCKHRGLLHHRDEMRRVKDLLRRNPGLHLSVNYGACNFQAKRDKCKFCKLGCHGEYADRARLGFYTHDAGAECHECCDDSVEWVRL